MIWGAFGAPHKGPKKIFEKKNRKWKIENVWPQPYIYMVHRMQGGQPKAKTSQMGSNRDIAFPKRKVRKIKFGIGNHKSIAQTQAQKHASRQGKNHAENWRSQAADEPGSLPSRQPRSQATRQAARPATNKQKDKKRASKATNQRASQHASQAAKTPPSKPANQAASQPDTSKNNQNRKAERHTETATHTAKQGLYWPNCFVTPHRFQKGILLQNNWVRNANHAWQRRSMTKSNEIQIGNHMETNFYGKSQKAGLSKARASLITTFFS